MQKEEVQRKKYSKFSASFILKFSAALFSGLLLRLIPFRVPNVEPIMGFTMPFSKAYGAFAGFSFAVFSILFYDLITHTLGLHTLFTAFAYGLIGIYGAYYFKKNEARVKDYVKFSIFATLFFDAVTGLTVGPLFFHQSFYISFIGQVPFTILHLMGNISFAVLLSPAVYKILIKKKSASAGWEKRKVVLLGKSLLVPS